MLALLGASIDVWRDRPCGGSVRSGSFRWCRSGARWCPPSASGHHRRRLCCGASCTPVLIGGREAPDRGADLGAGCLGVPGGTPLRHQRQPDLQVAPRPALPADGGWRGCDVLPAGGGGGGAGLGAARGIGRPDRDRAAEWFSFQPTPPDLRRRAASGSGYRTRPRCVRRPPDRGRAEGSARSGPRCRTACRT